MAIVKMKKLQRHGHGGPAGSAAAGAVASGLR